MANNETHRTPVDRDFLPVLQALHDAHMIIARSDNSVIAAGNGAIYTASWAARHAAILALTLGDETAAGILEDWLLDESGEGVAYFVNLLAQTPSHRAAVAILSRMGDDFGQDEITEVRRGDAWYPQTEQEWSEYAVGGAL